jgi:16S rRNA (guanine527-N7)-methyltransferase
MNKDFTALLNDINIKLNDKQIKQFDIYYKSLVEWNKKINLTAITEENDVYIKHFYDSIFLSQTTSFDSKHMLDIGAGAGFPSIPLKIIFPNLDVTIIDALKKRIDFLSILTKELDLEVKLIHGRAEEHSLKNTYDIVTARAVANLRMLSELCLPFVRRDGYFIAMKGQNFQQELEESKKALLILKAKLEEKISYKVDDQNHIILRFKKIAETPDKYPRRFSKIKSKPL